MTAWHSAPAGAEDAVDIPPAMTRLICPIKLLGVLAVLLGACDSAPPAQALHAAGGQHPARDAAPRRAPARGHATPYASAPARAAIIGGAPAQAGTFTSLAFILDVRGKIVGQCTGTVVAPDLVLTAGHCAENMKTGVPNKASGYSVVTGSLDWAKAGGQVSKVSGVLVYEGFHRRVDNDDAALLVLSTPTTAPPIALASASDMGQFQSGAAAMIAGWGRTFFRQKLPTEDLLWANTVVQGHRWCRRNAPPFYAASEICTIDPPHYATGACEGDSGGPLVGTGPAGEPMQIGITVHGYAKCSTRRPSVFTRVDLISSWVHTWIEAYKSPPPPPSPAP